MDGAPGQGGIDGATGLCDDLLPPFRFVPGRWWVRCRTGRLFTQARARSDQPWAVHGSAAARPHLRAPALDALAGHLGPTLLVGSR